MTEETEPKKTKSEKQIQPQKEAANPRLQNLIVRMKNNIESQNPGFYENILQNPPVIISLGCGSGDEFRAFAHLMPENTRYIGIDSDTEAARMGALIQKIHKIDLKIQTGNASNPDLYTDEEGNPVMADLIIIRSPNVDSGDEDSNWDLVIREASKHLLEDGLIYVTANHTSEVNSLETILSRHLTEVSSAVDPLSHLRTGKFSEGYFLVGKK